jgi:flagellar basal body-associated protein FliL
MRLWVIFAVLLAFALAALFFVMSKKKEPFTQTMFLNKPRLGPVLRSPNEETVDVLAYSLGGLKP